MEKILDQYIKDLIVKYPSIGTALNEFKIGCTTCSVGTCRLRDIIEVHGLSESDEYTLYKQIAEIIYPGQAVEIPRLDRQIKGKYNVKKFSPPIQMLVDEHTIIKKVIAAIPSLLDSAKADFENAKFKLQEVLNFIRQYADKFHHAKEEEILFTLFGEKNAIIDAMYVEHKIGRSYVQSASDVLETGDINTIAASLTGYAGLLTEHIRKEDEILYPWIDRSLSDKQVGFLYSRFAEVAKSFGEEPKKMTTFAQSIT